jgi:hypothetical protein
MRTHATKDLRHWTLATAVLVILLDRLAACLTGGEGWLPGLAGGAGLLVFAAGHCDGMDGPVVTLARRALESGNVNLVLPWVREQDEAQIREAFAHALAVRRLGGEARSLADQHFFETLVRVHRAGEGAPFTGLKPAGRDLGAAVPAADRALEDGSIDKVLRVLNDAVRNGLHEHYHRAASRKDFAPDDVKAGREYVEAYVPYIHYVERLWDTASAPAHGHYAEPESHAHAH